MNSQHEKCQNIDRTLVSCKFYNVSNAIDNMQTPNLIVVPLCVHITRESHL